MFTPDVSGGEKGGKSRAVSRKEGLAESVKIGGRVGLEPWSDSSSLSGMVLGESMLAVIDDERDEQKCQGGVEQK